MSAPFPHDLPDLLRLACGQGQMRLYVSHSAERGHSARLARTGDGWDIDHHRDPLESMARVLRGQFAKMLEREREKLTLDDPDCKLKHHLPDGGTPYCDCGGADDEVERFDNSEIEDAIAFVLARRRYDDAEIDRISEAIIDALYGSDRPATADMTSVDYVRSGAAAPADDDDLDSLL